MACYVDTSALIALCVNEPQSEKVSNWYAYSEAELVTVVFCVTEFASALGLKQRNGQITVDEATAAWLRFDRLCTNDLQLLPAEPATFHKAALMILNSNTELNAHDALHLAAAMEAKVDLILTLDQRVARNAKTMEINVVELKMHSDHIR